MRSDQGRMADSRPTIAYALLWFPLSSETFIFREIVNLQKAGLKVDIHTMYGKSLRGCSRDMLEYAGEVRRMGSLALPEIMGAFFSFLARKPGLVWGLARRGLFRKMRNFESLAENVWCFFAGFLLARRCGDAALIHSAWANGPATAAWVASRLTGIPFAFTGRAGDIYPQDGILAEKAEDALFIRVNNAANLPWLASFCPPGRKDKVKLVYNSLTFPESPPPKRKKPAPPYTILAVGRFARTKGFPDLLTAMARLRRENFPVSLTLVGDGSWRGRLLRQRRRLGLEEAVSMPGFLPHDQLSRLMDSHDLLVVPSVVHANGDRDGIPNVIMEAMSRCMPVVATDVCGISEVVRTGETGILTPQRDPARLAAAIRSMLENGSEALEMGEAGGALVRRMFDPEKNSAALEKLYLDALEEAACDGRA